MSNNNVVEIHNLLKQFPVGGDFFTALKKIDLKIETGEFTGLVGPSGSGKTTLLNIIGGLDSPTQGTVNVLGSNLGTATHNQRAEIRK
ncbi:MAG: ATP-binding cassette domain-containing protein, partial [Candidatus Marinimicrobia bacterium]|nr:ATP-binding cassette domain-containing protein [Candidatus Neomarinimicrobiota bacterium]